MLARLGVFCAALLFVLEGACFLERPGPNAGELAWGPGKTALYQTLFAVRPPHIWNLRWPMLIAGAATLAAACFLVQRMIGLWGFIPAAVLLATDPAFIFSSRLDSADLVLPRLFLILSPILFLRFWKTAARPYLTAAFAALSVACTNPAAVPVALAILIAGWIAFRPEVQAVAGWRNIWPSLIGLLPILALRGAGPSRSAPSNPLRVLDGSAWFGYAVREQPGTWGVGPQTWAQERLMAFASALGSPRHDMLAVGLLAAFVAGGVLLIRSSENRRPLLFSLAVPLLGYSALAAARLNAWSLLTPFVCIATAVALSALARHSIHGVTAAAALTAACGLSNVAVTASFYKTALLYGGTPAWTEATYRLAGDLDVRDARDLCVLAPGTAAVLQFLERGRAHIVAPPGGEDTLYIAGTDEQSIQKANDLASTAHRRIQPVRFIQDFQGRAVFVLYRME